MTASTEMLIDVGLNVLGFIAAGGLMMVFQSIFRRSETKNLSAAQSALAVSDGVEVSENSESRGKVEFVNFQKSKSISANHVVAEREPDTRNRFQRNRLEVIKQAREMLNAGKGATDIRRKLPIAEAELNMINQQRNSWSGRGAANDQ